MTDSNYGNKYFFVQGAIWIATICITAIIAFLIVTDSCRNDKFYLSLFSILMAESFLIGYPAFVRSSSKEKPLILGGYLIFWTYGVLTLLFAILATSKISFNHLLALNLILLLCLIVAVGFVLVGKFFISDISHERDGQRNKFIAVKENFIKICLRLESIENPDLVSAKALAGKLNETMQFSTSEDLPGSEDVTRILIERIKSLDEKISTVENLASSDSGIPANLTSSISGTIKNIDLILAERERLAKQLRNQ